MKTFSSNIRALTYKISRFPTPIESDNRDYRLFCLFVVYDKP